MTSENIRWGMVKLTKQEWMKTWKWQYMTTNHQETLSDTQADSTGGVWQKLSLGKLSLAIKPKVFKIALITSIIMGSLKGLSH